MNLRRALANRHKSAPACEDGISRRLWLYHARNSEALSAKLFPLCHDGPLSRMSSADEEASFDHRLPAELVEVVIGPTDACRPRDRVWQKSPRPIPRSRPGRGPAGQRHGSAAVGLEESRRLGSPFPMFHPFPMKWETARHGTSSARAHASTPSGGTMACTNGRASERDVREGELELARKETGRFDRGRLRLPPTASQMLPREPGARFLDHMVPAKPLRMLVSVVEPIGIEPTTSRVRF